MSGNNKALSAAKNAKKDEFYTQYDDIEKELIHYKDHFYGKVVYCNCDTPDSNFVKFFENNFQDFGLKGLIHTSIQEGIDFRSDESIKLLKQSDIIVTNPPFSLFREYVARLVQYNKKFLILGNINAITYKEVFPLFKDNKIWLGVSIHSGDRKFNVPDHYELTRAATQGVDENGRKYVRIQGVRWFTNLEHKKRHENIDLVERYYGELGTPEKYPRYDNYDAIEVPKTKYIPKDYDGVMGVPISFMDKYNPDQFEIVDAENAPIVNGKRIYKRLIIRNRHPAEKEYME